MSQSIRAAFVSSYKLVINIVFNRYTLYAMAILLGLAVAPVLLLWVVVLRPALHHARRLVLWAWAGLYRGLGDSAKSISSVVDEVADQHKPVTVTVVPEEKPVGSL